MTDLVRGRLQVTLTQDRWVPHGTVVLRVWCLLAGGAWGGIAVALGGRAMGEAIWAGAVASPLIGATTGFAAQRLFARVDPSRRKWVALGSVYAGAVCFALAIGVYNAVRGQHDMHAMLAALAEAQLSVLWGTTVTGFIIALWPLAYLSHVLVERSTTS